MVFFFSFRFLPMNLDFRYLSLLQYAVPNLPYVRKDEIGKSLILLSNMSPGPRKEFPIIVGSKLSFWCVFCSDEFQPVFSSFVLTLTRVMSMSMSGLSRGRLLCPLTPTLMLMECSIAIATAAVEKNIKIFILFIYIKPNERSIKIEQNSVHKLFKITNHSQNSLEM